MANTIYGPFTAINVVNGTTPANATWGNNVQTQAAAALHGFNPDLVAGGFVLSGIACWKDGTVANQLDIAAGSAYVTLSDNTVGLISVVATTQTTSTINTTYYLFLKNDGTWQWGTSSSGALNAIPICRVTTDASGNISGVADARGTAVSLLPAALGSLQMPSPLIVEQTQNASLAGRVVGSVTFGVAGAIKASFDTAITLNGTNQNIIVPVAGLPTGNANWSLEVWFKISANPAAAADLLAFGTTGTTRAQPGLQITTAGGLLATTYAGDTAATGAVGLNVWHHAVATWDGTTLRVYLDGVAGPTATPGALVIGIHGAAIGSSEGSSSWFPGSLDEAAFYGSTLSAAQVTAHYNAGISTAADNYASTVLGDVPLRYYRLGDTFVPGAMVVVNTVASTATTVIDAGGTVKNVGGIATGGRLGVAPIITSITDFPVTSIGTQVFLTTGNLLAGMYRAGGSFYHANGSGAENCAFQVQYTDRTGTVRTVNFSNGAGTVYNGATSIAVGDYAAAALTFSVQANSQISILFNDPAGTPNDVVSAIIERVA